MKTILGIETSCDETAAAIVRNGREVIASAVASQMAVHRPFRGVVPELASRAHVERINQVIDEVLRKTSARIDAIAVTNGPGLVGCLLVGTVTARMLGWVYKVPVIGVNHLEGHLFAGLVEHRSLKPPFLGLIVSGGHTELIVFKGYGQYQVLGRTRDDAAGEAFDKVANMLDLPFPGGPSIDRQAKKGNPRAIAFPRAWLPGTSDFSFSGLKTSVANYLKDHPGRKRASIPDICASFQEAVADVLVTKTFKAAKSQGFHSLVVGGGVAANSRLRALFQIRATEDHLRVFLPNLSFCTDNAAMIAAAGYYKLKHLPAKHVKNSLTVNANLEVQSWKAA